MRKGVFLHTGLALLWLLVGSCASTPDGHSDPEDPLESYNRKVHRFNQVIDDAVMRPIAKGYRAVTPEPLDRGITNFFNNLWDISSAVNNLLQFKLARAGSDVGRLAMNSTIGLFGFFDVATNIGFPSYKEDFGQTFGYWGDDASPYLVLPFLGPSTLRDIIGLGGDILVNPLIYLDNACASVGLTLFDIVDTRSDLLSTRELMEEAALDPYVFVRDAYLQRRCDKIFDGRCPPAPEEEDMEVDEAVDDDLAAEDQSPATTRVSHARAP